MKKILIIIGKLCVGGAERVARDIGYYADPEKYEIHYLVFEDDIGDYEPELEQKGCKIIHMPSPGENHLAYYRDLSRLIRREKYDVIHSHTMFSSGWAMMAGKVCSVPVRICHSHSIRGNEKRGTLKNLYENTMRRIILSFATHYVACGQKAGEWLYGERVFRKKGILILNGVGLDRFAFDPAARSIARSCLNAESRFIIGHAGHLAPVKNQTYLLDRMPEILKHHPDALLLLLGEGPDRPALEEKIRALHLDNHVKMMGNVSNVEMYLSAMDVFAFPSFYEGTPLAMIEAQTNGLPCVISDRIPSDVHLTELITVFPLENAENRWVEAICASRRNTPETYLARMKGTEFDLTNMLHRIYALYEG
jgi:glycosyltransferase involved in cell wall biosynthesis